jgi:pimeloyl-ACP methyl ester carboxylesterase
MNPFAPALVLSSLLLCACGPLRPQVVPIPTIDLTPERAGRCLVVLLPGRFARPEEFRHAGFAEAVAARGLPIDLVAVDAHLGYYRSRSVVDRLRTDIITPARAAGYEQVWIAGTSLGGLGGLIYLKEHPEDLAGVLSIAPFLGDDALIGEIEQAGGAAGWTAPPEIDDERVGVTVWRWLAAGRPGAESIPLYLGWGNLDDFDRSNRLLAQMLPPGRTYVVDGGHDFEAWDFVWAEFLDSARPCEDIK